MDFIKMFQQMFFQVFGRCLRIGVRATERFGHNFIHELEFEQVLGGDFEGGGGLGGIRAVLPQNRRATFRADDGIIGVFQNQHAVGHADAERAAGTAFADDGGDDGHFEQRHFPEIHGDGLGDVAFLRANARIRARRVNERDDGQAEFVCQPHQAERLAIAFGMGAAEIAQDVLLGVTALLRADDHDAVLAESGKAAHHGAVLGKQAVAVQFLKIGERLSQVIQRVGTLGMAGQLHALPGVEVRENLPAGFLQLLFDELDFLLEADAQGVLFRVFPEVVELGFAVR